MFYLAISTPAAAAPSTVHGSRTVYWDWVDRLREEGVLIGAWSRVGRGAVAIFSVESNEALHVYLNQWAEMIPATFEVMPLIDPGEARSFLAGTASPASEG